MTEETTAGAHAGGRIVVPGLRSRSASMWVSVLVAGVAVLGIVAWALVAQPVTNQLAAVVLAIVLFGGLGALAARRTWLDTERGTLVRRSWNVREQTIAWSSASRLRLQPNHADHLAGGGEVRESPLAPAHLAQGR